MHYDTFASALTTLPAAVFFVGLSSYASRFMSQRGGRATLALGIALIGIAFLITMLLWQPDTSAWVVLVPYAITGAGIAFAGAAASTAIMESLPGRRAGMGSALTDLTRDFGGALIQALMGAILAVYYSRYMMAGFSALPPEEAARTGQEVAKQIAAAFQTAEEVAAGYPQASAAGLRQAAELGFSGGKTASIAVAVVFVVVAVVSPDQ